MKTKHTPGPWEIVGNRVCTVGNDRERIIVATVPGSAFEALNADQTLIAAAPDMLDALQSFAAVPCEYRGNIHCTMLPAGARAPCGPCAARAAIAKAT